MITSVLNLLYSKHTHLTAMPADVPHAPQAQHVAIGHARRHADLDAQRREGGPPVAVAAAAGLCGALAAAAARGAVAERWHAHRVVGAAQRAQQLAAAAAHGADWRRRALRQAAALCSATQSTDTERRTQDQVTVRQSHRFLVIQVSAL